MTREVRAFGAGVTNVFQEMGMDPMSNHIKASVVELAISCRQLSDMDVFSKSDPMCVLYTKPSGTASWQEFGRTEVIWNNLNPNFVRKFVLHFFFEEQQRLRFEVYDIDSESEDLSKHDFLGLMECNLSDIMRGGETYKRGLTGGPRNNKGIILVKAEELKLCKEEITLKFCGKKLDKKDFCGKSDPFLLFYRTNEDGSFTVTHKTEVIKTNLNPKWQIFTIPVRSLCNGDHDRSIRVECFDYNKNGSHSLIGSFSTTVRELSKGPGPTTAFDVINPVKKAKKRSYIRSGTVELMKYELREMHTFIDYIKGGTEIQCIIAIDFTTSNGDPREESSLHYKHASQPNQYQMALRAVGEIIQDYDTDKLFPAFGFGAKIPPDGKVSHDFNLNGHPSNPHCEGIDGVLEAYNHALDTVQLSNPTNFAPVINHVTRMATEDQAGGSYFILLIITDGVISDMPQTCEAIVNAAILPISIIIVGVGDADFTAMEVLDGDKVRLSSRRRNAERDIVQFVPFREFLDSVAGPQDFARYQARLAKKVLEEVPEQFISWMKKKGVNPRPPLQQTGSVPTLPPTSTAATINSTAATINPVINAAQDLYSSMQSGMLQRI